MNIEAERLQWRRSKVLELSSQGNSQPQIARILQVGLGTVNRDLQYLRQEAKQNIKRYIDEKLPEEYEKTLCGLNGILREAWAISQASETGRMEKIKALSLAKDCYLMKLELLTNATVIDDAIRFVQSRINFDKSEQTGIETSERRNRGISSRIENAIDSVSPQSNGASASVNQIF